MNNSKINQEVVEKLIDLKLTISTCESMTGGLLSNNLVQIEHASQTFKGGLVTYSDESKIKFAKVEKEIIDKYGTVSVQCAKAMAEGCQRAFNSDIAISITGNASVSNPTENKAGGEAYVGFRIFDQTVTLKFTSKFKNRTDIIDECVAFTMFNLWELIKEFKK